MVYPYIYSWFIQDLKLCGRVQFGMPSICLSTSCYIKVGFQTSIAIQPYPSYLCPLYGFSFAKNSYLWPSLSWVTLMHINQVPLITYFSWLVVSVYQASTFLIQIWDWPCLFTVGSYFNFTFLMYFKSIWKELKKK